MNLRNIGDKELVAELNRRKAIKQAQAWSKLAILQGEIWQVLHDHELLNKKWSSCTDNLEEEAEQFFHTLWGACGGNDIGKILKTGEK